MRSRPSALFRSAVIAAGSFLITIMGMSQDASPPDPPLGISAQEHGALRLSELQTKSLKVISAAPLPQFYPVQARLARRPGMARLDVLVDAEGGVVEVRILEESPLGEGFGEAAAAVAKTFKYYNPFTRLVVHVGTVKFSP
jgi:TonB family protein